jgi:hypothetical protein
VRRHRNTAALLGIMQISTRNDIKTRDQSAANGRYDMTRIQMMITPAVGLMGAVPRALAVGLLSTLSMDLLTGVATGLRLIAPLSPRLVGRWFASVARAQPFHADIARSSPVHGELLVALPVHYVIGTVLAAVFVWASGGLGWSRSVWLALAFGLSTSVLPWLVMFPAMGYGFFGTHGPRGLFVTSLISHAFFGIGLWTAVHVVRFY